MIITQHAKQRMKERCGFNRKSQERMARIAFNEGITHAQTKGRLNKWITSLYFRNKNANNIRIYGDNAYIFADETLVTVIHVPLNLKKDFESLLKYKEKKDKEMER